VVLLLLPVAVGACGSSGDETATTTASPTTTIVGVSAGDEQLIVDSWKHLSDASLGGPDAIVQSVADSQYPGTGYTADDCRIATFGGEDAPAGYMVEYVVDESTIRLDPEWVIDAGSLSGVKPDGTTYAMGVRFITSYRDSPATTADVEVRVTILDGVVYHHPNCG